MIASLNYDLFCIRHFLAFCYLTSAVVSVFIVRSEGPTDWFMVLLCLLLATVHWYAARWAKQVQSSAFTGCMAL
jgi:hypothetical protein